MKKVLANSNIIRILSGYNRFDLLALCERHVFSAADWQTFETQSDAYGLQNYVEWKCAEHERREKEQAEKGSVNLELAKQKRVEIETAEMKRTLADKRKFIILSAFFIIMVMIGIWYVGKPVAIVPAMIAVKGGTFTMGDTLGDGNTEELPTRSVRLSPFWIGKYEVTQREWVDVMGNNPSDHKGDDLPVESVSWFDAIVYCNKRSSKEGLIQCYSRNGDTVSCNWQANGYRLPTEAEWEYAAKGGILGAANPTQFAGSDDPDSVAWYSANSGGTMQPVGQKKPNQLGIFDMSGNVWEWCWDWYGPYPAEAQHAPRGPESGRSRVLRGGSYVNVYTELLRSSRRYFSDLPRVRSFGFGFRLVRSGR